MNFSLAWQTDTWFPETLKTFLSVLFHQFPAGARPQTTLGSSRFKRSKLCAQKEPCGAKNMSRPVLSQIYPLLYKTVEIPHTYACNLLFCCEMIKVKYTTDTWSTWSTYVIAPSCHMNFCFVQLETLNGNKTLRLIWICRLRSGAMCIHLWCCRSLWWFLALDLLVAASIEYN